MQLLFRNITSAFSQDFNSSEQRANFKKMQNSYFEQFFSYSSRSELQPSVKIHNTRLDAKP
jgi:hypothetical protein